MFLTQDHVTLNRENIQMAGLVAVFVICFSVFMAMMIFLLFKIIYKKLETRFFKNLDSKMAPIRPISYFLPDELDSRLEKSYQNRRGSFPNEILKKLESKNGVRFA